MPRVDTATMKYRATKGRALLWRSYGAVRRRAGQAVRRLAQKRAVKSVDSAETRGAVVRPVLDPREAYEANGFCVFRQVLRKDDLDQVENALVSDLGSSDFDKHLVACDAANNVSAVSNLIFEDRILGSVRGALGDDVRFLQVSGMQANNDFVSWHRDSACREVGLADWDTSFGEYKIAKAILYVRGTNTTLAIFPNSHRREVTMDKMNQLDGLGRATVIHADQLGNVRFTDDEAAQPIVVCLSAGDLIVFDQRMYHRGGRFDEASDRVVLNKKDCQSGPAKLTLSWVFGGPNQHSERYYSYFRFARQDLTYSPINPTFRDRLVEHDLYLPEQNRFEDHVDELDQVWLRRPETLDLLKREFVNTRN